MGEVDGITVETVLEGDVEEGTLFAPVPAAALRPWRLVGTVTVEARLDDVDLGRRLLRPLDSDRWFVETRKEHRAVIRKRIGDVALLTLRRAATDLPAELVELIETNPSARARWEARSEAERRSLREDLLAATKPETRRRRAERELLPDPGPKPMAVRGLGTEWRTLELHVIGEHLPGRTCGVYAHVRVGLVRKVRCHPFEDAVPADEPRVEWVTPIAVRDLGEGLRFRGGAVNGPQCERFVYLTWLGRLPEKPEAMFRRAKIRLDAVPPEVLADALETGRLVGRLGLTDACGMPLCASVRPPVIRWSPR